MNSRLFLIPAILATTAAFSASADVPSAPRETRETLGQHPAVLVAQQWSKRGIDPNTFIVAHPAGLQVPAAEHPLVGKKD